MHSISTVFQKLLHNGCSAHVSFLHLIDAVLKNEMHKAFPSYFPASVTRDWHAEGLLKEATSTVLVFCCPLGRFTA
jgi:hypothetical protein